MPVPYVQQFTDGLSRAVGLYDADSGKTFNIETREAFVSSAVHAPLAPGTGSPNLPVRFQARYLHLISHVPYKGKQIHRKVPCNHDSIAFWFAGLQIGANGSGTFNLDGIAFDVVGYTGEYLHKTRG